MNMQKSFKIEFSEKPLYGFNCPDCLVMFPTGTASYTVKRVEDRISYTVCTDCIDRFANADASEQAELFEEYIMAIGDVLDD